MTINYFDKIGSKLTKVNDRGHDVYFTYLDRIVLVYKGH